MAAGSCEYIRGFIEAELRKRTLGTVFEPLLQPRWHSAATMAWAESCIIRRPGVFSFSPMTEKMVSTPEMHDACRGMLVRAPSKI